MGGPVTVSLYDVAEIRQIWHPGLEMYVRAVVGWDGFILAWAASFEEIRREAERDAVIRAWWR